MKQWVDLHKEHIIAVWRFAKKLVPELDDEKNREYFVRFMFRNQDFVHLRNVSHATNMRYPQCVHMEDEMVNATNVEEFYDESEGSSDVFLHEQEQSRIYFIPFSTHYSFATKIVEYAREDGYLNSDRAIDDLASLLRALQTDYKIIFV